MHPLRAILDLVIPAAQAHEKWFVSSPAAYAQPEFFHTLNPWTAIAVVVTAMLVFIGFLLDPWYEETRLYARIERRLRPLRDHAAGVLAVSVAVLLLFNAWSGTLLATNFPLGHDLIGVTLRAAETTIGFMLLVGLFTPFAAAGVALLYLSLFALYPVPAQIEIVNLAGAGAFLFFFSRGRWSLDWFLGKPIFSTPKQRKAAYVFLRATLGAAILALAFWNKWLEPGFHLSLMDRYPAFNPYALLKNTGLFPFTREQYVFSLFFVEITAGLFELFGLFTRAVAVLLVPVFCASVVFLPPTELVGHLPVLGTLFVLFVYGDTYYKGRAPEKAGA